MSLAARFLLLAALVGTGCITERRGTQKERPSWRIGVTTPREVVSQWGNPDLIQGNSWIWWDVDAIGGKLRVSYLLLGVTLSNTRRSHFGYCLTFAPDGKLAAMETYESLLGGGKWSLSPW